eukprot:1708550-Pyramimonas_sp.AAC.2
MNSPLHVMCQGARSLITGSGVRVLFIAARALCLGSSGLCMGRVGQHITLDFLGGVWIPQRRYRGARGGIRTP